MTIFCYVTLNTGACEGRGVMTDDVVGFEHHCREFEKQPSVGQSYDV